MDVDAVVLKMVEQFDTQLLTLLFKLAVVAILVLLFKGLIQDIVSYIVFRTNRYVGIGTPVEVYGKIGRIRSVSLSFIVIETEKGFIPIPTRGWRSCKYHILKDSLFLKDKRI